MHTLKVICVHAKTGTRTHTHTHRWNKFLHDKSVLELGCGLKHTVILLDDGTMHSCGNNEKGQLAQDTTSTRPGM